MGLKVNNFITTGNGNTCCLCGTHFLQKAFFVCVCVCVWGEGGVPMRKTYALDHTYWTR